MSTSTKIPNNTQINMPRPAGSQKTASNWRGFAVCYAAGLALLLVTTGTLKLAFAALG
ncbi:hypothetical protein [Marinobacterium sedimentorum]|uniref:hypothetical protein n=1 Tax=Marinobacterium sedimentorum TaxID=2927804 RepID=UPI0020C66B86|nr:hypothetical protein [Marinobacterium sedimentorum]MCP8688114.1 hypothetical protein [Marinobacterium sedimentorum]